MRITKTYTLVKTYDSMIKNMSPRQRLCLLRDLIASTHKVSEKQFLDSDEPMTEHQFHRTVDAINAMRHLHDVTLAALDD